MGFFSTSSTKQHPSIHVTYASTTPRPSCSAELCSQVVRVCRALSRSLPFRSLAATGGHKLRTQREALAGGVDVLVATPGRLQELMSPAPAPQGGEGAVGTGAPALRLDACRAVVLDEVDVLLGERRGPALAPHLPSCICWWRVLGYWRLEEVSCLAGWPVV